MTAPDPLWLLLAALLLDAIVGDPRWLWRHLPHPVALMGHLIAFLDRLLNREDLSDVHRRAWGIAALATIVLLGTGLGLLAELALRALPLGWLLEIAIIAVLLAQRSLYDHVKAVGRASREGPLDGARQAVARIVGRDPQKLDRSGIHRAAIESLAENFSDGVVAPALWYALLGLPGLLVYKFINTADSMVGHHDERFRAFGWACARFDDLINLPASRLSALLILMAGGPGRVAHGIRALYHDASRHRSPNAGWPEAAMAGVLGIALAGPRHYANGLVDDPWMNSSGRTEVCLQDLEAALNVYLRAILSGWLVVAVIALVR